MTQIPEAIWAYEGYGQDGRGSWYDKDKLGQYTPTLWNTVYKYIHEDKYNDVLELWDADNKDHISKYNTLEAENEELREALEFCVSVAEGDINANWDDLLGYRKTLNETKVKQALKG